jgi:hypothetical protein
MSPLQGDLVVTINEAMKARVQLDSRLLLPHGFSATKTAAAKNGSSPASGHNRPGKSG